MTSVLTIRLSAVISLISVAEQSEKSYIAESAEDWFSHESVKHCVFNHMIDWFEC